MTTAQETILSALLDLLHGQDLIDLSTYEHTNRLIHSMSDFPAFFRCPAHCRPERE